MGEGVTMDGKNFIMPFFALSAHIFFLLILTLFRSIKLIFAQFCSALLLMLLLHSVIFVFNLPFPIFMLIMVGKTVYSEYPDNLLPRQIGKMIAKLT